jgi:hypothetical protein
MPALQDLLHKSIPELNEMFVERRRPVPKGLLEALKSIIDKEPSN